MPGRSCPLWDRWTHKWHFGGEACRHGKLAFCSEKCICVIASLQISLPPFLFPPSRRAHGSGLGRSSLNPSLFLPTIPPSAQPAFLPLHPSPCCSLRTVCSNPAGAQGCCRRLQAGALGTSHPQPSQTLLEGTFGVASPARPPKPFPSAPRAVRLCWGRQQCRFGGIGARMQL